MSERTGRARYWMRAYWWSVHGGWARRGGGGGGTAATLDLSKCGAEEAKVKPVIVGRTVSGGG